MSEPMLMALVAIAIIALTLIAILRFARPKPITLPDYPELPAPPKDDGRGPGV